MFYTLIGGAGSQEQARSRTGAPRMDALIISSPSEEGRVWQGMLVPKGKPGGGGGGSGTRTCRQMLGNGFCAAWTV